MRSSKSLQVEIGSFSFQIATEDQAETDRYWDAIVGNGGAESECGWCKDKWGLSWQITPRANVGSPKASDAIAARRRLALFRAATEA